MLDYSLNGISKGRLGSFEGENLGQFPFALVGGAATTAGLSAQVSACNAAPSGQDDQSLINCYPLTAGSQQQSIASELRLRNYELVGGQWQKKQVEEGTSAGEVLTGIAAILNPLATAGVGIFQAQQQARLQKLQIKSGGGFQQPVVVPAPRSNNTGVIIAVVVVVIILAGMILVLNK
jgi:hypothetical protein